VTVLIEGQAGIGKTSLVAHARRRADAAGMTVLHARGSPLEREFAMGVVRQCFEPELRRRGDADALLAGPARLAAPAVREVPEGGDAAPEGILHGLYWLAANLAEQAPVLVAVDDLQWADEASLRFIAYLARRVESLPLALVVGTRPPDDGLPTGVLDDVRREPATVVLEPEPLDGAAVEQLLRSAAHGPVEPAFAAACRRATGGNPFLLEELARTLREARVPFTALHVARVTEVSPPTVTRSVRATLDLLGPGPRAIAAALSVLGDEADVDLVAELAGVPLPEATFAAGELARAGLFADAPSLRFRHPLLAAAVRAAQPAAGRAAAHGRAAALLRARGAGPERVALQLLHAGPPDDPEVVGELRAAAGMALRRGAPATALALLRRVAGSPGADDRAETLLELGCVESAVGATADATAHLEQSYRLAADPLARGRAALALFDAVGGDLERVFAMRRMLADGRAEVLRHDRELAMRLWGVELVAMGRDVLTQIEPAARGLTGETPGEAVVLGHLVFPMMHTGASAAEVTSVVERAARQSSPLLEEGATSLVITAIVIGLFWTDRLDAGERLLDRAIAVGRRRGSSTELSLAHSCRASVHWRAGRLAAAEADARVAAAAAGEPGWGGAGEGVLVPLVATLVDAGRLDEADRELIAAVSPERDIPDHPATWHLRLERMRLRLAQRRYRDALVDWDTGVAHAERLFGIDSPSWVPGMAAAAAGHLALGDRSAAAELAARAVSVAERWGTPGLLGQALHARAQTEPGDPAIETLREAVAALERSPARLELARALLTLGAFLRRRGDRIAAREPLRRGHELARACGAPTLADAARAELRATGIRVERPTPGGRESLTASERRIAELAAAGAANPEIAQELFLTVKTVEMHLTRAYRKLDIKRRTELARALTVQGPVQGGPRRAAEAAPDTMPA
jgi:DNA-binding CsgD family transcriptional regulator